MNFILHEYLLPTLALLLCAAYVLALLSRLGVVELLFSSSSEKHSLMDLSHLGVLQCICDPTRASEPKNDRRRSCRACGSAIRSVDPMRLYEQVSRRDIRLTQQMLRRATRDAAKYTGAHANVMFAPAEAAAGADKFD